MVPTLRSAAGRVSAAARVRAVPRSSSHKPYDWLQNSITHGTSLRSSGILQTMDDEPPPQQQLHDSVVQRWGWDIVSGALPPGTRIIADDAATQLGVSRTVIREAVRVLDSMGLITVRRRVGITVLPPEKWNPFDLNIIRWRLAGPDRLRHLQSLSELRSAIEPLAARLAADNATPEQCGALTAAVIGMSVDRPLGQRRVLPVPRLGFSPGAAARLRQPDAGRIGRRRGRGVGRPHPPFADAQGRRTRGGPAARRPSLPASSPGTPPAPNRPCGRSSPSHPPRSASSMTRAAKREPRIPSGNRCPRCFPARCSPAPAAAVAERALDRLATTTDREKRDRAVFAELVRIYVPAGRVSLHLPHVGVDRGKRARAVVSAPAGSWPSSAAWSNRSANAG